MTNTPQIPIQNVYYLFCYAWNRFEEAQAVSVGAEACPDLPNLLATVLLNSARLLLKRGLDREYRRHSEAIATVRGHIDIGSSLHLRAKRTRQLHCEFDELTADVPHNQVIKASLLRLARAPTIDRQLAHDLRSASQRFVGVGDIELRPSTFSRIRLHRNNAHYELALRICELAFESLIPAPEGVGFTFHDILRDERKMARVFEEFVRNFYRIEQREYQVSACTIKWDITDISSTDAGLIPTMRTDIFLYGKDNDIIIDTKYYYQTMNDNFGKITFRSGHLYQLYSYLMNYSTAGDPRRSVSGLLLYPQTQQHLDSSFEISGHRFHIRTIDLSADWSSISASLKSALRQRVRSETLSGAI